jgi:hypothetical protein
MSCKYIRTTMHAGTGGNGGKFFLDNMPNPSFIYLAKTSYAFEKKKLRIRSFLAARLVQRG